MNARIALMLLLVAVLLIAVSCLAADPAGAQTATPTPYPAIAATATAAAERVEQARQAQAQADALTAQAQAAQRNADTAYQQAQQAASEARSALAAQQAQQAGEALGRAEAGIEAGRVQVASLNGVTERLQSIITSQVITLTQISAELQLCRDTKQTLLTAYTNEQQRAEERATSDTIGQIAVLLSFIMAFILLVGLVALVLKRKRAGVEVIDVQPLIDEDEERNEEG